MARMAGGVWDRNASEVYATFPDLGIPMVDADPALEQALRDAAVPITAKWIETATAAGIDAQAALDFYTNRVVELTE
jgi:hypothetical protein